MDNNDLNNNASPPPENLFEAGRNAGYADGRRDGYNAGYNAGFKNGYSAGFEDARRTVIPGSAGAQVQVQEVAPVQVQEGAAVASNAAVQPVPVRQVKAMTSLPPVDQVPVKVRKIRSAYSRAGLGLVAFSKFYELLATVLLFIGAGLVMIPYAKTFLDSFSTFDRSSPSALLNDIVEWFKPILSSPTGTLLAIAYAVASALGIAAALLILRLILSNRHYEPIQKARLPFGSWLAVIFICFFVWVAGILVGNFTEMFVPGGESSMEELVELLGWRILPFYAYAMFGAPVFEELACRKLLCDRLHKYGQWPAAVISGLLFGLLHGNSGQFFLAFFIGIVFACVYMKTGKIIHTILLHFMINTVATVPDVLYLAGIDLGWYFYIGLGGLALVGLICLLACRKSRVFDLTRMPVENPSRHVFANRGMLIAVIAGTVSIVVTGVYTTCLNALAYGPLQLLNLISVALVIVAVLIAVSAVSKMGTAAPAIDETGAAPGAPDTAAVQEVAQEPVPESVPEYTAPEA